MDPFVALLSWLTIRGPKNGYIFCDVKNNSGCTKINCSIPLSASRFTKILPDKLRTIGIGTSDVSMFSGHSLKRGCVQLLRSLGLRDKCVMERIQMTGSRAYTLYTESFNDCAPTTLPRFASNADFLRHADRMNQEKNILLDQKGLEEFIEKVGRDESVCDAPVLISSLNDPEEQVSNLDQNSSMESSVKCNVQGCIIERDGLRNFAPSHKCSICSSSVHVICVSKILKLQVKDSDDPLYCTNCFSNFQF